MNFIASVNCSGNTTSESLKCIQDLDDYDIIANITNSDYKFEESEDYKYSENPFFFKDAKEAFLTGKFNRVPIIFGFDKSSGATRVIEYLNDEEKLSDLNDNWDSLGTDLIFDCSDDCNEEQVEIALNLRYTLELQGLLYINLLAFEYFDIYVQL